MHTQLPNSLAEISRQLNFNGKDPKIPGIIVIIKLRKTHTNS